MYLLPPYTMLFISPSRGSKMLWRDPVFTDAQSMGGSSDWKSACMGCDLDIELIAWLIVFRDLNKQRRRNLRLNFRRRRLDTVPHPPSLLAGLYGHRNFRPDKIPFIPLRAPTCRLISFSTSRASQILRILSWILDYQYLGIICAKLGMNHLKPWNCREMPLR